MIPLMGMFDANADGFLNEAKLASALEANNPPCRVVSEMAVNDRYAVSNGTAVYFVDMKSPDKGIRVVTVPVENEDGLGLAKVVSKIDEYVPVGNSVKELVSRLDSIGHDPSRDSYGSEMAKILQYNYGNQVYQDKGHPYIPGVMDKAESLDLMRNVAADIGRQAVESGNGKMKQLSEKMFAFSDKLKDPAYTQVHVQSVFNTIAEREPELMGDKGRFQSLLNSSVFKFQMNCQMERFKQEHGSFVTNHFAQGLQHEAGHVSNSLGITEYVKESADNLAGILKAGVNTLASSSVGTAVRDGFAYVFDSYQPSVRLDTGTMTLTQGGRNESLMPTEFRKPEFGQAADKLRGRNNGNKDMAMGL